MWRWGVGVPLGAKSCVPIAVGHPGLEFGGAASRACTPTGVVLRATWWAERCVSPPVVGTGTLCGARGLGLGVPLCVRASFAVRLELEVCLAPFLQHSVASPRPAASVSHGSDPLRGLPPIEPRPWERAGGPEGARSSRRAPGLPRVALTVQRACKMHPWAHVCLQGVHTQACACRCVHAKCQGAWERTRVHATEVCVGCAWVASCTPACVRAPQHHERVQGFAWSSPEVPHTLQLGRHRAVCARIPWCSGTGCHKVTRLGGLLLHGDPGTVLLRASCPPGGISGLSPCTHRVPFTRPLPRVTLQALKGTIERG